MGGTFDEQLASMYDWGSEKVGDIFGTGGGGSGRGRNRGRSRRDLSGGWHDPRSNYMPRPAGTPDSGHFADPLNRRSRQEILMLRQQAGAERAAQAYQHGDARTYNGDGGGGNGGNGGWSLDPKMLWILGGASVLIAVMYSRRAS